MEDRWTQIRLLFRQALEKDPSEWTAFLEEACPDDPSMRARVAQMLAGYGEDDAFLEAPAAEVRDLARAAYDRASLVGTRVGAYEIRRPIAQGGMGLVFEAFDTRLEKVVALKMLHPGLAQDPAFRKRFDQEAKTLARLEDPHFVQVHAVAEEGANTFIVMEYIQGPTLAQRLKTEGYLSPSEAIAVGIQVLQALEKAHRQDIVHRDLKPSNLMLKPAEEGPPLVKVLDWGIAKQVSSGRLLTQTQSGIGTLSYMSPEQVRGLTQIDHRTDLYSLAVTLYESLCGHRPFEVEGDEFIIRQRIVTGEVVPLHRRNPAVPEALSRVIMKAMAVSPEDRYPSAEAMREALLAVAEAEKTPAAKPSPRRLPMVAALLLGLIGLVAVGWLITQSKRTETSKTTTLQNPLSDSLETVDQSVENPIPDADSVSGTEEETLPLVVENLPDEKRQRPEQQADPVETLPRTTPPVQTKDTLVKQEETQPETPVEEAGLGFLEFKVSPSGDIYVNDTLYRDRVVVHSLGLPAGRYQLRVENANHGTWTCPVAVASQQTKHFEIAFDRPVFATIVAVEATSQQPVTGATIVVDGKPTAFTTPQKISLSPGIHRIEVQKEGFSVRNVAPGTPGGCFLQLNNQRINFDAASMGDQARVVVQLSGH